MSDLSATDADNLRQKRKLVDDHDFESNKRMAFAMEVDVEDDVFFKINFNTFTLSFRKEVGTSLLFSTL